jgi:hypothetical protein
MEREGAGKGQGEGERERTGLLECVCALDPRVRVCTRS